MTPLDPFVAYLPYAERGANVLEWVPPLAPVVGGARIVFGTALAISAFAYALFQTLSRAFGTYTEPIEKVEAAQGLGCQLAIHGAANIVRGGVAQLRWASLLLILYDAHRRFSYESEQPRESPGQ
jgi:hypothetical protein